MYNFSSHCHENFAFSRQFVDVQSPFLILGKMPYSFSSHFASSNHTNHRSNAVRTNGNHHARGIISIYVFNWKPNTCNTIFSFTYIVIYLWHMYLITKFDKTFNEC